MRPYLIEIMLCMVLLSLLLAGDEGPQRWLVNESATIDPTEQIVISPPSTTPIANNADNKQTVDKNKRQGLIPVRLHIPKVKIDAQVEQVGLLANGAMDVPKDDRKVGWFRLGYQPGAKGNAVMAGHVDNLQGVAVFHPLHDVSVGDLVYVYNQQKKRLTFKVTAKKIYPADRAPVQAIFGPSPVPNLNLITCTGYFDPKLRTHVDRLVIYTQLVTK